MESKSLKRILESVSQSEAEASENSLSTLPFIKRIKEMICLEGAFHLLMEANNVPKSLYLSLGYFAVLPNEILYPILSMLDIKALLTIKRASREWKSRLENDELWRILSLAKGYRMPLVRFARPSWFWLFCSKQTTFVSLGRNRFMGRYRERGLRSDLIYEGEFVYTGSTKVKEGFGTLYDLDPQEPWSYTGGFERGKRCGFGRFENEKNIICGEFDENRPYGLRWLGRVILFFRRAENFYEGKLIHNTCTDKQAIYQWKNGDRYYGEMEDGTRSGKGMMILASGEVLSGYWLNDVLLTPLNPLQMIHLVSQQGRIL